MNRWVPVLISTVLLLFVLSCKTGKKTQRTVTNADTNKTQQLDSAITRTPENVQQTPSDAQLQMSLYTLWTKEHEYKTFKGKAKMHYEGLGMSQDFTANIRMAKDSVIWVHISAGMGLVSVARIYITPDSVLMVNYLEKQVTKMGINDINKLLPAPMEYSYMENLIVGEVLDKGGFPVRATRVLESMLLEVENESMLQTATYSMHDSTMTRLAMQTKGNSDGIDGSISYYDYSEVSGIMFPAKRDVDIQSAGRKYYLQMNFVSAEFDTEVSFPFSIPDSYTLKNY